MEVQETSDLFEVYNMKNYICDVTAHHIPNSNNIFSGKYGRLNMKPYGTNKKKSKRLITTQIIHTEHCF